MERKKAVDSIIVVHQAQIVVEGSFWCIYTAEMLSYYSYKG